MIRWTVYFAIVVIAALLICQHFIPQGPPPKKPMTPEERNASVLEAGNALRFAKSQDEKMAAIAQIRHLAEDGEPRMQNLLGWIYEKGDGVPADNTQAMHWYLMAKRQGFANGGDSQKMLMDLRRLPVVWPDGEMKVMLVEAGNSRRILMKLTREGFKVTGVGTDNFTDGAFLPVRSSIEEKARLNFDQLAKTQFAVEGSIDDVAAFEWNEINVFRRPVGVFKGAFIQSGSFMTGAAEGNWTNPETSESMHFTLRILPRVAPGTEYSVPTRQN